ncbi:hypothetical protein F5878DRAFT_522514, partial [Lentinula raphanica]
MCLFTVIPGKPKQHHINHALRVLVNQLLPFWGGVSYTRMARYRTGRTVFMALLPVVCDTEAAIQISGFAAHNHTYFCRRCLLPISHIHNLEPDKWVLRNPDRHKELAVEWKEASRARRDAIYRDHGVRWTELLNLPYWNPIPYTVIDDMHLGYPGLFRTHLRIIWGIDHEKNSGDGMCPDTEKQRKLSKASLRRLLNEIRANSPSLQQLLEEENRKVIWYLCFELKLRTGVGNKHEMVKQILQWVICVHAQSFSSKASSNVDPNSLPPVMQPAARIVYNKDQEFEDLKSKLLDLSARAPSLTRTKKAALQAMCQDFNILYGSKETRKTLSQRLMLYEDMVRRLLLWARQHTSALEIQTNTTFIQRQEHRDSKLKQSSPRAVIGKDLLEEIWADMARSVLPSWIQPAPQKWGIPATGKLSADEYKVVCSISLVITLIRVWGYGNKEAPQSRHYQMLLNFLDLVRSIHVVFLRETTQSSRAYYQATMLKYLRGVLELFPDAVLSSNHHLALHIIADLETLGPGHARSTPVFERINHLLQETKKNGHLGEVEATMMTSYGRMANLQILLASFPDLREEIEEALVVLKDIEREDHRGM